MKTYEQQIAEATKKLTEAGATEQEMEMCRFWMAQALKAKENLTVKDYTPEYEQDLIKDLKDSIATTLQVAETLQKEQTDRSQ